MADTANSASSGLIVFLPLVAAFVGAIIGAWANSWYRDREAKKAQDRELKGLIILMLHEHAHNNSLLKTYRDNPDAIDRPGATNLQTEVWTEAKTKLAQNLPLERIAAFTLYYGTIENIEDALQNRKRSLENGTKTALQESKQSREQRIKAVERDIRQARQYSEAAMGDAAPYIYQDLVGYRSDAKEIIGRFVRTAERLTHGRTEDD